MLTWPLSTAVQVPSSVRQQRMVSSYEAEKSAPPPRASTRE